MSSDSSNLNDASILDPYTLMSGDNPGLSLTTTPFNGVGFLGWSRTIKMALGAKMKLGFIDGSLRKPESTEMIYQKWIRCDFMVTCWILNSMTSELSSSFVYADSAYDLWQEILERYGHTNGPLIYQVQRELNEFAQGDLSIVAFFSKLKKFWDELENLIGKPVCSCGKVKECVCGVEGKFVEIENQSRLMQFLMKLNQEYENVRNQVLAMDPLPSINKAYYIVQQVERQKSITQRIPEPAHLCQIFTYT